MTKDNDVICDVDANGILNVVAVEKSSRKEKSITITSDRGRLSAEDIERMVHEAEDESNRERVEERNAVSIPYADP
jgi:L1 cell adhesion molecule like protein